MASPLYAKVADHLKESILEGLYLPGSKIPSVRQLSKKFDVSISTVLESYSLLESQGLIEAKPKSGYFVKIPNTGNEPKLTRPSAVPRFVQSDDAFLDVIRSCADPDLVPLGGAVIHPSLLPFKALVKSMNFSAKENIDKSLQYEKGTGNWDLRKEIARRGVDIGCQIHPQQVIITTGATEALQLSLRAVTKPGDVVAVESPTYHGILHAIESLGLKVLELPTCTGTGLDLAHFEEKIKKFPVKAAVLTPNFQNPLGSLMVDEDKEKLVQLCSKNRIALIEDGIYAELNFEGRVPRALKSFDKNDEVIYCSSFSKTLAAGLRVGWIVAPKNLMEIMERLKFSNTISTNSISQLTLAHFLRNQNYDKHMRRLRQTLAQNIHRTSQLVIQNFPEGTKVTQPKGGCLLWVEMPNQVRALELHQKALKEKISIIPGPLFSATGKYQNCVRINCGNPWEPRIEKSLLRIAALAKQMT